MPSQRMIFFNLVLKIKTEDEAKVWCVEQGLIKTMRWCPTHQKYFEVVNKGVFGTFRCRGKINGATYDHTMSLTKDTWFEQLRCDVRQRIILTYLFARGRSFEESIEEASIFETTLANNTAGDVFKMLREVCRAALDRSYESEGPIGGEGVVVEIDEMKLGKRKYERGRKVDGHWILGMIERGGDGYRLEICPENKRSQAALLPLIKKHVKSGSEIHTDLWKGYSNLSDHGFTHKTVNHSKNFVDPISGAYTQNIEAIWRSLRRRLSRGGLKSDLDLHLCEFLWRRRNRDKDLFLALLEDIKVVYPGPPEVPNN